MAKQPELPLEYGPTGGTARYGAVEPRAAAAADMFARKVGKRHDLSVTSNIRSGASHYEVGMAVGKEFDNPKPLSRSMRRSYRALEGAVNEQYEYMTRPRERGGMGLSVQFVEHEPYSHPREMQQDVEKKNQIKILSTRSTGGHSLWSDEQNDRFRAVHDVFGHMATARDFSTSGEEAAFQSHAMTMPKRAMRALASETRAQNAYYATRGDQFPPNVAVNVPEWATRIGGRPKEKQKRKAEQPQLPFDS